MKEREYGVEEIIVYSELDGICIPPEKLRKDNSRLAEKEEPESYEDKTLGGRKWINELDGIMITEFQDKKIISQGFNPFEQVNKTYLLIDEGGDIIQIRRKTSRDIEGRIEFIFTKYKQNGSEYKAYSRGEVLGIDLRKSLINTFRK